MEERESSDEAPRFPLPAAQRGEGQGEGRLIKMRDVTETRLLSPALSSILNGGEGVGALLN